MKVVVLGCTHAGTAAVLNTIELYKEAEVTVYERNDNVSFLSCGIALHVQGVVKDIQGLFYCSPEKFRELGVKTCMQHDVTDVDFSTKTLTVKNLLTGEVFTDTYDKLIISTGSWPIEPPIENAHLENVMLCKNYGHAKEIVARCGEARNVAIVGAGYIGTELVEAFETQRKSVTFIDQMGQVLPRYLDPDVIDVVEELYKKKGVRLAFGRTVKKFEDNGKGKVAKVITTDGEFVADLVVLCVGFRPQTALFKDKLDMLPNGAILVDDYMHTSVPDVFAAGDCCSIISNASHQRAYIPLATNAVRMGTLAARNLKKPTTKHMGTQGTSGIKIYDWNIASTGLTELVARDMGMEYGVSVLKDNYRPEFMDTTEELYLKLVYEKNTGRILGGQVRSKVDLTQSINTLSVCIQNGMTVEELAFTDFFFQPHFNKPWNFLNAVALQVLPPVE